MEVGKEYRTSDFEILLDVKSSRVRKLLGELIAMGNVEKIGGNRDRRYKLNKPSN